MRIDNEFTVHVPIEEAWKVLLDLETIAPCLPGAQLTAVDGDDFRGKVKIKVGPVVSEYAGVARFVEKDGVAYHAVIDAKGKDSRGNGNAAATITAQLRSAGDSTVVSVDTDLNITGKIAQFGSGTMKEVSAKLLGQFAENLEAALVVTPPAVAVGTVAVAAVPSAAVAAVPSAATATEAAPVSTRPAFVPTAEVEPLDLLAIAGSSVLKRAIPVVVLVLVAIAAVVVRRRSR